MSDAASQNETTGNYTVAAAGGDLWEENEAFARAVIPSMLYVAVLMVLVVPGNSLVVYVYGFRFRSATHHFLIVSLAVCNLLIGLIAMPTEITDLRFHLTFSSDFACRLLRFLSLFCSLVANCILVVIAVDRFRRVCYPLHRQMTIREARIGTALSVSVSLLVSWPLFVMTGLRTTETTVEGLYGKACSFSDEFKDTVYPKALIGVLGAGFVVKTLVLMVLYAKIWREAQTHSQPLRSKRFQFKVMASSSSSPTTASLPGSPTSLSSVNIIMTSSTSPSLTSTERLGRTDGINMSGVNSSHSTTSTGRLRSASKSESDLTVISPRCSSASSSGEPSSDKDTTNTKRLSIISRHSSLETLPENAAARGFKNTSTTMKKKEKKRRLRCSCCSEHKDWSLDKATLVAFAVTVTFVLSFLPYLTLMVVRSVKRNFDHSLSGSAELNAYNIFVRSFFVNCGANPVIYGVINARFRRECVALMDRLLSCCWRWWRCVCCWKGGSSSGGKLG
ncbi:uncharacterized protein LOC143276786 [Babylonia areolata]|uniref:uncharacterized protein LOC143276786 n=1 Tax=Babylonia areolata TaxID=304850 RepID=UPI003FD6051A